MRTIKVTLILLLVITCGLYAATSVYQQVSGVHDVPEIQCSQDTLQISVQQPQSDLLPGVTASDKQDGDLTSRVIVGGISKLINKDTAKVTYLVFDSDDNMASCVRYIQYTDYRRPTLEITEPLVFSAAESLDLIGRLRADDVIDGDISSSVRISALSTTDIAGVYSVTAQVTNSMGDTAQVKLPVIVTEDSASQPEIRLKQDLIYLQQGDSFNPLSCLTSVTLNGQNLSTSDVTVTDPVDTSVPGTYWVQYAYTSMGLHGLAILTVVVE